MHDFDFDVMQKKTVARSAKYKRASSRGPKGCSLPSDNMTPAQIRKLSSEPVTYRLDRPMTWKEFNAMPEDLQAEYLRKLIAAYGVNASPLSKMFGITRQTVLNKQNKLGIPTASRGARMNVMQERHWQAFLEGVQEEEQKAVGDVCIDDVYSLDNTLKVEKAMAEVEQLGRERMELYCFTACITGHYSPEAMAAILGTMPIPDGKCIIRIEVSKT